MMPALFKSTCLLRLSAALFLAGAGAAGAATPVAAAASEAQGVAWLMATADGDVDKAFAQARAQKKPVLLYWGAKWCPPCNQLKATLFNRADFIERSRAVVAVYIDGDAPGAQKLGDRFKASGYPTLILLNADGTEITRLPGEADAPQVLHVLDVGLAGGRPLKAVLADAQAGRPLKATEWQLLAFYSWDADDAHLLPEATRAPALAALAAKVPAAQPAVAQRLWFKALAVSDDGKGLTVDAAWRDRVQKALADKAASRALTDVLTNSAADIVRALHPQGPGAERSALVDKFNAALQGLEADASLSRADRVAALQARIDLARIDQPKGKAPALPEALLRTVREVAERQDREITSGYERQAVVTAAAHALHSSGQDAASDALLNANLAKSHSPYYLMTQLARNAKDRGDKAAALKWYEEAFNKSEGPATRLQWGANYLTALVELSPQDEARVEKLASQLFAESARDKGAFFERSGRSLQKVSKALLDWNGAGQHKAPLQRLQAQLDGVCGKLDAGDTAQRNTCGQLLKVGAKKAG